MTRADRRYKKWERATREWATDSARALALDLYYGHARPLSAYGIGVSLEPGEILYREVSARYWTLGKPTELIDRFGRALFVPGLWRDWGWCSSLLTSRRLVTRLSADHDRLISNWWAGIGGVQVDLDQGFVALDSRTSDWRAAYCGPSVAVISVGAVGAVHGLTALVEHPGLQPLREEPLRRDHHREPG